MKEFKGTPGPWLFNGYEIESEQCDYIADVYGTKASTDEEKANANLIAASPELISALQQLLEIHDDQSGKAWTTSSKRRALDNARAAVNKALGETK